MSKNTNGKIVPRKSLINLKYDHDTKKNPQTCHLVALLVINGKLKFENRFSNINTEAFGSIFVFTLLNKKKKNFVATKYAQKRNYKKKKTLEFFFCGQHSCIFKLYSD